MSKKNLVAALLCILIGIIVGIGVRAREYAKPQLSLLSTCLATTTDPTFASTCLNKTVPLLLTTYSVSELEDYTVASTTDQQILTNCHPIGHIIGEQTYKKYGSIEEALAQCSSVCRSACTHGVIGAAVLSQMGIEYSDNDIAHADTAELTQLGVTYCAQGDSICHAIGHVAYIASQNDQKAISICNASAQIPWNREACFQGIFMERAGTFLNALYPDHAPTPPTVPGNYTYPCGTLPIAAQHACFLFLNVYQTPLFDADGFTTPTQRLQRATEACEALAAGPARADCFEGVGLSSRYFGYPSFTSSDLQPLCDRLATADDRSACTLGVLQRFFYGKKGLLAYCAGIGEADRKSLCYDAAFEWNQWSADTALQLNCESTECLAQSARFKNESATLPDYRYGLFGIPK